MAPKLTGARAIAINKSGIKLFGDSGNASYEEVSIIEGKLGQALQQILVR